MKASAAFAIGLWTGAVVVAAVGAFQFRALWPVRAEPAGRLATEQQTHEDELLRLRQENAHLVAEANRLRQTVAELKRGIALTARAVPQNPPVFTPRPAEPPAPLEQALDQRITDAVLKRDATAMRGLEDVAANNNELALEALALLADQDGAMGLMRVWNAEKLSFANKVRATQYIGATVEVNPQAETWLKALFAAPNMDATVLFAALSGLARPAFASKLAEQTTEIAPPPRVRLDYVQRVRLFATLRPALTDERLRDQVDKLYAELVERAGQPEAAVAAP